MEMEHPPISAVPEPIVSEDSIIRLPVRTFWTIVATVVVFTWSVLGYVSKLVGDMDGRISKGDQETRAYVDNAGQKYLTTTEYYRLQGEQNREWDRRLSELKDLIIQERK